MARMKFSAAGSTIRTIFLATLLLSAGVSGAQTFRTLHIFTGGKDGSQPYGPVTLDAVGNVYGSATQGGLAGCYNNAGCGLIFKLTHNTNGGWTERALHRFTGGADGGMPIGNVIFDLAGSLYGTAGYGVYGSGVVFELQPQLDGSWKEKLLYSFKGGSDGTGPAGLVFDNVGNLFGTTSAGGDTTSPGCDYLGGCGTVFELSPNPDGTWKKQVLHEFSNGADGSMPWGELIFDNAGNLYGTTPSNCGDAYSGGTVFELSPNADGTWTEHVIGGGGCPYGGVVLDATGNLYGTTHSGGRNAIGTVFELTPDSNGGWVSKTLHGFMVNINGKDGAYPFAGVTLDSAGNLYGTTPLGGSYEWGIVYKLFRTTSGAWSERIVYTFRDLPSAYPIARLTRDPAGNLYGTTYGDSSTTWGTVFEITP